MSLVTGVRNVCVPAPAKINLFLSVGEKREDGFHELLTVMAKVRLFDHVIIEKSFENGEIKVSCPDFPEIENENNLAVKMVNHWRSLTGINDGIRISLAKNIPMDAGLGGGSSDAVATLFGLNALSENKINFEQMSELSAKVGSDCPAFLLSGTCIASGRGEKVRKVDRSLSNRISGRKILLFKPKFGFSTSEIYGGLLKTDLSAVGFNQELEQMKMFENGEVSLLQFMRNDLENPILRKYLFVPALFKVLRKEFKLQPMVCGSGSSCFVVVSEKDNLEMIKGFILESWGYETFMVETELI